MPMELPAQEEQTGDLQSVALRMECPNTTLLALRLADLLSQLQFLQQHHC